MALVLVEKQTLEKDAIHCIYDNIYLGNKWAREYIKKYDIKRVIEIGEKEELDEYIKIDCDKLTIVLKDSRDSDIESVFKKAWDYIDGNSTPILIHCKMGVSRSVSILISYLIARKGFTLEQSLQMIKDKRNDSIYTHPKIGFIKALRKLEKCKINI